MSVFDSIQKNSKPSDRSAIPAGAIAHLDKMGTDRCFAGSVVFVNHVVPAIWLKLSKAKARKVGILPNQMFTPDFKFNTIEDYRHDLVTVLSLMSEGEPPLQVPLNPGHRAVQDFLELLRSTECFCIDVTVGSTRDSYGASVFLETSGDDREWVGRNFVRSRTVAEDNDWQSAFRSFGASHHAEVGAEALVFDQPDARIVDARRSKEFITRGEDDYEPDLSVIGLSSQKYRYNWLREEHGLNVADQPMLLVHDKALIPALSAIEIDGLEPLLGAKELERLRRKFPGESFILSRLLLLYRHLGNERGEQSVLRELATGKNPDLFTRLLRLSFIPPEERIEEWQRNWPHPEAHHYLQEKRTVTLDEFFPFEECAIFVLTETGRLPEALRRFNRLVEFGCLEEFFRPIADGIARQAITEEIERTKEIPRVDRKKKWPGVSTTTAHYLDEAYLDHASFLVNELKKRGVEGPPTQIRRRAAKTGRNEPCPCGSGKKYKNCCGK